MLSISIGVVDQHLFFTIYIDDGFKLGVHDDVHGVWQRLRKLQFDSNRAFLDQVKVAFFREIRRPIVSEQSEPVFVFLAIDVKTLVSSIFSASSDQRQIPRQRLMILKV